MSFTEYANSVVETLEDNFKPIEEVDCIEFITSDKFLGERLFPYQRVILKTFYNLWLKYPPDEEEMEVINILWREWGLKINTESMEYFLFLILVLGRRSGKSTLMSFIGCYEMYSLICKDNPQKYYGIRERHPIHVMHVAAAGPQAEDVFTLTKNNIRRIDFFRPYIDFDKDSSTELRLFTPFDLRKNDEIRLRNSLVPRGIGAMKESTLPGSLTLESITTSAATNRGKAVKVLMLSEFAHFPRGVDNQGEIQLTENLRTDYAIWKAMTPSVKDFKQDGRVFAESSPKEKAGEFYKHYCIGGGSEQDSAEEIVPDPQYRVFQLATWQARPSFSYEDFEGDFRKDPIGANMEYGAHFGNPSGGAIDEAWILRVPQPNIHITYDNYNLHRYVISIDAGGKAKKKKADTYAIGWGHAEGITPGQYDTEEKAKYWIDGLKGFDSKIVPDGNGRYRQEPVDPNKVMEFILDLIDKLGGRQYIQEIVYDQFESSQPVALLQSLGLPAVETFFTNPYKSEMYGDFLSKLITDQVRMYGVDVDGWVRRWQTEMKFLQRRTEGNYTYYSHPSSGPVQNDDFADVTANLVHRLAMIITPTKKSVQEAHRKGLTKPIPIRRMMSPVSAGSMLVQPGGNRIR